jgi:hypothetical protein
MRKALLGLMLMAAAVGCTGIYSVGPLAKSGGGGRGDQKTAKDLDQVPDPVTIPAPTPTPPKCNVQPEDVTAGNTDAIMDKLRDEFDFDRKNMPSVPTTVEVSHIR